VADTGSQAAVDPERRLPVGVQRLLILGLLVGGAAATMYIWWRGAYEGGIDSTENLVGSVGQVSGLMSEYLILVLVLLMARVPWLERAIGTEHLTKMHVIIGFAVAGLIAEHVVCAVYLNMAPGTGTPMTAGLAAVFLSLRDVLAAAVGTALIFGVVALSTRKVRRRIPYEVWRYLHWFVYVGISLQFLHQLSLGVHFLDSRAARYFWLSIHAVTLACVLWYRFGTVIRLNLRHRLSVEKVVPEGPGVYSLYFTGRKLDRFEGTAGQFCRWRFLNREGWWQSHPFSLSAAPTAQYLRITVKQLGDWTRLHLPELEPGTRVFFSGPYGGLTPDRRKRRKVLLLAAGIGITPMRSLLAGLPAEPGDLTLVYRASSEKELVFREELNQLARQRRATVHYLLGPREYFTEGEPLGAAQLRELVPDLPAHDVYVCGPDRMLEAAIGGLRAAKVPRRQIHTERFAF
jgi:predicted ferric reductase